MQQTGGRIGLSSPRALAREHCLRCRMTSISRGFLAEKSAIRPIEADLRHRDAGKPNSCPREMLCKRNPSGTFFTRHGFCDPPSRDPSRGSVKLEAAAKFGVRYEWAWYFGGSDRGSFPGLTNPCFRRILRTAGCRFDTSTTVAVDSRNFDVPLSKTKAKSVVYWPRIHA